MTLYKTQILSDDKTNHQNLQGKEWDVRKATQKGEIIYPGQAPSKHMLNVEYSDNYCSWLLSIHLEAM